MNRILCVAAFIVAGVACADAADGAAPAAPGSTFLASYLDLPAGAIAGADSTHIGDQLTRSPLSNDGRYVAFLSDANTLSTRAHPDVVNVFRKDRTTGAVELISRATGADGAGPAFNSSDPRITADGGIVAFNTKARLSPADTDDEYDIYLRFVAAGITSLATPGNATPVFSYDLSADGRYIAFATGDALSGSDANAEYDIYRRDLVTSGIILVSRKSGVFGAGNAASGEPSISDDGHWVTYTSAATNLVAGFVDNNGGADDVFVRNMGSVNNYLVSSLWNSSLIGADGETREPQIAGTPGALNTVVVAYSAEANDVANPGEDASSASSVFRKSMPAQPSELVSVSSSEVNADSRASNPAISNDGELVTFSSDATNLGAGDDYYGAYLRDMAGGNTSLISDRNEYAIQGDVSGNGGVVTWSEFGGGTPDSDPDLYGAFARTVPGGSITLVSRPPGTQPFLSPAAQADYADSDARQISADGRYVVFQSYSSRLPGANGTTQIYRRDMTTGSIEVVSRATGPAGAIAPVFSSSPSISADGNRVAFVSFSHLDPVGDTNSSADIYVRDLAGKTTVLASRAGGSGGAVSDADSDKPSISSDGTRVAFESLATNFGAPGGDTQIYVRDLNDFQTFLASRAAGVAGPVGDNDSSAPSLNGDGTLVAFDSRAVNLHPVDADIMRDVHLRNLTDNSVTLLSRLSGLTAAKSTGFNYSPAISPDGKVVAFETEDDTLAPEAGAFPGTTHQIVSRVVATGKNTLVSRAPGGLPADRNATNPSIDGDGSVIAFESGASNLVPGTAAADRDSVFVRQMTGGAISAPPAFGIAETGDNLGSSRPSISESGDCLTFTAEGYNGISLNASDVRAQYVHVVSGTCSDPRKAPPAGPQMPKPKLTKVSLSPKKFAVSKKRTAKVAAKKKRKAKKGTKIRLTLNAEAAVTIRFEEKAKGRKVRGKCRKVKKKNRGKKKCNRFVTRGKIVRESRPAGRSTVSFSGRIGKKKLKPGKYRAVLRAMNDSGVSKVIRRGFRIVRR